MLRRLASATLLLLFACDDGPACVIDTDCEGLQICVEESCVPLGGERDAAVDGPTDTDDAGEGDDAGPTDMGPEPGSLGTGTVSALSVPAGSDPLTEPGSHTVSASFAAAGGSSLCTTTEVAGCTVVTCEPPPPPPEDAGMPEDMGVPDPDPFPHAGSVQLSGGSVEIAMEPAAETGLYPVTMGGMQLFSQGDTLVGIGAGDEVPSFRTTGLQGVDPLTVTAPALSDLGGPLTLDSTMATDVTWTAPETPTEDQTVQIGLTSVVGDGGSVSITCDVPVADESFTLTPEVFAMMPGSASHRIRVITRDAESLDRDGWLITVEAWARGLSGVRNYDVGLDFSDRVTP